MDQGDGWTRVRRIQSGPGRTHFYNNQENFKLQQFLKRLFNCNLISFFYTPIIIIFKQSKNNHIDSLVLTYYGL